MEDFLRDHLHHVAWLLAGLAVPFGTIMFKLGKLARVQEDHEERISDIEEEKVDVKTCEVGHHSLGKEIGGLRQDFQDLRKIVFDWLTSHNKCQE